RVERVRHVRVDAAHAVPTGPRALAAGDGLVVRERPAGPWIDAADQGVVHGALRGGGDPIGERGCERAQNDVDDALRGLDVPGGDRRGRFGVQERAAFGPDLERTVGAGVRGDL